MNQVEQLDYYNCCTIVSLINIKIIIQTKIFISLNLVFQLCNKKRN